MTSCTVFLLAVAFLFESFTFSSYSQYKTPDNSKNEIESLVNWPNPDDHWSDIPFDSFDKWNDWGQKEDSTSNQVDDSSAHVYKRKVESYVPYSYQSPNSIQNNPGPSTPSTGYYNKPTEAKQIYAQKPFNSFNQPPPFIYNPFQKFSTSPTQTPEFRQFDNYDHKTPSQAKSTTKGPSPSQFNLGFFPSNLLVEYPNGPILNHPEPNLIEKVQDEPEPEEELIPELGFTHHFGFPEGNSLNRDEEEPPMFENFREPIPVKPYPYHDDERPKPGYHQKYPLQNLPNRNPQFSVRNHHERHNYERDAQEESENYQRHNSNQIPFLGAGGPVDHELQFSDIIRPGHPGPHGNRFPKRPRRNYQPPPPRRQNSNRINLNFEFPPVPGRPFTRRNNGRQFENRPRPRRRHPLPPPPAQDLEEQYGTNLERENELDRENSDYDYDTFKEDKFFEDPDFSNFDFSEFSEFDQFDQEEHNDSISKIDSLERPDNDTQKDPSSNSVKKQNDNMDFNYSREGLEMYKKSHQNSLDRSPGHDKEILTNEIDVQTRRQKPNGPNSISKEKKSHNKKHQFGGEVGFETFDPNFIVEENERNVEEHSGYGKLEQEQEQELLEYESQEGEKDPFRQFQYSPSQDDDFAEFDKFFDDFEEKNLFVNDANFQPNINNLELGNQKFEVITDPFDTSDLNHQKKAENLQEKLRTVDIWEMENQRIGERKKEEAFKSAVDDRAWIPITEASA